MKIVIFSPIPANIIRQHNVGSMLGHRLRRWPSNKNNGTNPSKHKHLHNICSTSNIVQMLYKCVVFAGSLASSLAYLIFASVMHLNSLYVTVAERRPLAYCLSVRYRYGGWTVRSERRSGVVHDGAVVVPRAYIVDTRGDVKVTFVSCEIRKNHI